MNKIDIIELKETILSDNDTDADRLRDQLRHESLYYLNVMASPGAGKTSVITRIVEKLRGEFRIGVMEADIDSDVDAKAIDILGIPVVQLHTAGMCHLDADMSRQGLSALPTDELDMVILENVGNLVCPAEFDTGAELDLAILSVPEGDDKPLKYPLMFQKAHVILLNKSDTLEYFDFDMQRFLKNVRCHTEAPVFPVSAETGEGMDAFCRWLRAQIADFRKEPV